MTDEQTDRLAGKGSNAPVFSGEDEDFDRWMKRLELWLHDTNVKEDKQAARIVNSQTNGAVLDLLLESGALREHGHVLAILLATDRW